MIGLLGASSVGKTTLAKAFTEHVPQITFITSSASKVYADLGVDPRADVDFMTRLRVQEEVLNRAEAAYIEAKGCFISDRTPLDFIAYTLADIQRDNITPAQTDRFSHYFERCLDVTNRYFDTLCLIQPGIAYEDDGRRPKPNVAYQEHINLILFGLLMDERIQARKAVIKRDFVDLQQRIDVLTNVAQTSVSRLLNKKYRYTLQ